MQAYRYVFTPKQLDKGMAWLLEQIAKRYDVYPQKICTMDGRPVASVDDFENKGAYVLIPLGEKFRDTWYFLPDGSLDTSRAARKERQEAPAANPNALVTSLRREVTMGPTVSLARNNIKRSRSNIDLVRSATPQPENTDADAGQQFDDDREGQGQHVHHTSERNGTHTHGERHVHTSYGRPTSSASNCSHCAALEDRLVHHHKQHMSSSMSRHHRPSTAHNSPQGSSHNESVRAVHRGSNQMSEQAKQMLRYSQMSRQIAGSARTSPVPQGRMTRSKSNLDEGRY
uniref:Doublecortin domain-containing protein n=1 Tax=Plectus sambesii TaxID=2011161 RepID=A0A914XB23_9BILA